MKKVLTILPLFILLNAYTQTVTVYLTTSGGSYHSEKWTNITTGINGTGTVVWEQGGGSIGTSAGLLTDEAISLNCGTTYYLNTFDRYDDGWDGTTYILEETSSGPIIINNAGSSPDDGSDSDATSTWGAGEYSVDLESSEAFSVTCPCVSPSIGTATTITTNCNSGTFDVQLTINSDGQGGSVTVDDGGILADQIVSSFPTTVTFSGYSAGTSVTLTVDNGTCSVNSNTVSEQCSCATPPTATVATSNLDCNTNTFDIQVTGINNGSGTSSSIYVDGVLDVAGSQLNGKTEGTNYTVTIVAAGSGSYTCETDYTNVTANCPTPCAGNATVLSDGYTQSNITTPGTGGADDWVTEAESCGIGGLYEPDYTEFEDSDVKLYSYTTGATAGESIYFTIEYDYTSDKSHSIGVWSDCVADSLRNCVTAYYNFDNISGICAQGLAANTTYYIGVTNDYFSREDLDFDIIDFTVEYSITIPDDECATAPNMNLSLPYDGSTRCSYTASTGSPGSCGTIENDSWIQFIADETTAVIDYSVSNCSNGNGVQLSAFSGSCGSMTLIPGSCLNYAANNSNGTWTFSNLTIGDTYYIRADGYAGDLCSYSYTPISGVLPITLTNFSGKALNNGRNRINWETSSEINNDYFVLESSTDGKEFEQLSIHNGAGNSSSSQYYFDYDFPESEQTYYRLKQVDFDGNFSYSKIIMLENNHLVSEIRLFPNPSNDGIFQIRTENYKQIEFIQILDAQGRIVRRVNPLNDQPITVDLSQEPSGIYQVVSVSSTGTFSQKVAVLHQ